MYHDDCMPGFYPPEPPPHQHGPNSPLQSYPIRSNCGCGEPMGGEGRCGEVCGPKGPADCAEHCTPVPPPIPPVRYVPGMNVQEQLCNMAERVNISINRWNQIQANCYQALDNVVGAAVNNDVYYSPDEVRFMEGYDEDSACSYSVVEAKAVDRAGKPILCHLRAAYNNETNSGARENITDVSFVTSAQVVITAVQATSTHWAGTTVFNCNPGNSAPDDTVWVCGWNRNGVLRFFRGDVGEDVMRQNRMVNCIGPVFPVIKDGKLFEEVVGSIGETKGAIQAIGWKPNGNKVFFSCGCYEQPGMTPNQVAIVLQRFGCKTAVITSYQYAPVNPQDATPIAGTESSITYDSTVIGVPGMTGGMTFLGKLTDAPIQWSVPANCANWVISKRPHRGWKNAFTTEVANVVQRLGNQENSMNSILGQLKVENDAISKLQYQVTQNTNNISDLTVTVNTFDTRITTLEGKMTTVENNVSKLQTDLAAEITTRQQQYAELKQADATERQERIAADNALDSAIKLETASRESADRVLQNNIDEEANIRKAEDNKLKAEIDSEATTRANADRNLQAAIEAEASARSTKDTQHEARMDAIEAQQQKDVDEINREIEGIKDGSSLPIATTTSVGVIKVGKNLTVGADGTLDAMAGEGSGDRVAQGPGISITETPDGTKVIGIDENVVVNTDELKAVEDRVESLETKQTDQAAKDAAQDEAIGDLTTRVTTVESDVTSIDNQIGSISTRIDGITNTITNITNGDGLPIASSTTLGAIKVGANLSISTDGVLSASAGEGQSGETVAAGTGIKVDHNTETNVATVSLSPDVQGDIASIPSLALRSDVEDLRTTVAGKANTSDLNAVKAVADKNKDDIAGLVTKVDGVETTANAAASGVSQLNSSVTALGNRVDNNTQNIDAVSSDVEELQQKAEQLRTDLESVDETATSAHQMAADAEAAAAGKVSKTGDTMTGPLVVNSDFTLLDVKFEVGADASGTPMLGLGAGVANNDVILNGIAIPIANNSAVNKSYVDAMEATLAENIQNVALTAETATTTADAAKTSADAAKITADNAMPKSGGDFTGLVGFLSTGSAGDVNPAIILRSQRSNGAANIRWDENVINFSQYVPNSGVSTVVLRGINDPVYNSDAVTKSYVDTIRSYIYNTESFTFAIRPSAITFNTGKATIKADRKFTLINIQLTFNGTTDIKQSAYFRLPIKIKSSPDLATYGGWSDNNASFRLEYIGLNNPLQFVLEMYNASSTNTYNAGVILPYNFSQLTFS